MPERDKPEDDLETRLNAGLDPIGQALRATYPSDNHDSLGKDLTGLMLHLAQVDEPGQPSRASALQPQPAPSWLQRLFARRNG